MASAFAWTRAKLLVYLAQTAPGRPPSFYAIVGLVPPDTGRVMYDDEDITDVPMYLRARQYGISYLPQEAFRLPQADG